MIPFRSKPHTNPLVEVPQDRVNLLIPCDGIRPISMQKFFLTRSCLTRYCLIANLFEHRLGQHFPIGGLPIHQPGNHNKNG
jgi:hypothetical protein